MIETSCLYHKNNIYIEIIDDKDSDVYRFRAHDEITGRIIRAAILKNKFNKYYRIESTRKNLVIHLMTMRKMDGH